MLKSPEKSGAVSSTVLILVAAVVLMLFYNGAFFSHLAEAYPLSWKNLGLLFALCWIFTTFLVLLLGLLSFRPLAKPLLATVFVASAVAAFFMDTYNTVIDASMIRNVVSTDAAEAADLLSLRLFIYVGLLGILPSVVLYKIRIQRRPLAREILARAKLIAVFVTVSLASFAVFGDAISSFAREHKTVRLYSNPGYYLYSLGKFVGSNFKSAAAPLRVIGADAAIPTTDTHRELVIFVVGETARFDRFSLNGYERETNPLLKKESVISFTDFWSCGTSTAVSVPCMFSNLGEAGFDAEEANSRENVLDVLRHSGVNVLWLDNNSSSKGVADRVEYVSYKSPETNPNCDAECRDEGMLSKLNEYIDSHPQGDLFIVLHQFGSHGPAYFKRYPPEFEKFTPVCQSNELAECSKDEIGNAYDNGILYTDYFLSKVIQFLKAQSDSFETAMFYVSDHGESLGEGGLYLHGLPKLLAPEAQRHVPAIMWLGESMDDVDSDSVAKRRDAKYTHDNVFHTIMGLMEVDSSVYDPAKDILRQ